MPTGAGLSPAGTSVAGVGVLDSGPQPGVVPLPDPKSGAPQTGRFINQLTGDYEFTADGRVQGMSTVPQLVVIALQDIDLSAIQEKGPNFKQHLASVIQDALGSLIAQGYLVLGPVTVLEPNPDAGLAVFEWYDQLAGGKRQETTLY